MPGANLTRVEAEERAGIVSSPIHYAVELDLTKGPKTFGSRTTLRFDATPGAETFLDIIADSITAITFNGEPLGPAAAYEDSRIALKDLHEHNEVIVEALCRYSNTGEGLHRSVDPSDGNVYLYSQFEVPDARRVYAVFDQPDIKAVFDFTMLAPESWIVTSNMPVALCEATEGSTAEGTLGDHAIEGIKRWVFEPTPVMSSYLTAICAGPYAQWHTEYANEDGRTVPMAMYCRQALKDALGKDVDYLFDITKKGFAFYAKTWGVPYPYAKFDQIYVPEYNAGAMENIGMVTIRDSYLFESKVSDALVERRVVTVLHELAHMWFGDLVTMKWWNDLWLNESFAEFMSTLATAEATEWHDSWATFTSGEKSWALNQDQLSTTHPIVAPINDLHDTEVNFDGITYAKGASVLKQLVAYVGREQFFTGINSYLTKHQYGNATLADLLTELEAASGRDLKAWSAQWLEQAGINTIAAEVETAADGTITAMTLKQSAPAEHPVLRAHRLAIGFYDVDNADNADGGVDGSGTIVRTDRFELDVDGESTEVPQVVGRKRPAFILVNDDDLTYTKLRFDADSLEFAAENLYRFDDALARATIWLSLWDMTRDAEFPAERFADLSLKMLATEHESTTFRYALATLRTTVMHYVAAARADEVAQHAAAQLWQLAHDAQPGSDEQFQLVSAYLGYGTEGDAEFAANAQGLLDGSITLDGLEIDNNLRWAIIHALAVANLIDEAGIDAELAKRDTTENREFAYGARAAHSTSETKNWAWDQALDNDTLTNSQLEEVIRGFAQANAELAEPYIDRYFQTVDWIWKHKTFHMAENLIGGLYPFYADPAKLVSGGTRWLETHADADRALRHMISANVEASQRTLNVRKYNESL
ncbi:aminopeptidase N [Bifidobacterium tibiigranuli]|jgi:aminopeptidase N|uniref:aminopeptidase N n=1 Tax=Bifidobacterium tibiigranuli TaxID=2172043 RepID=UPI0026F2537B|nr:aminopeptidase N [Bifidobacterium tibiigranuli]MCI2185154.1 aminopeptidase N [Bifidobacterium tibiigranuli]MCI2203281.1 aminopeptidase N [Bifidobacterium tibiigranuli]